MSCETCAKKETCKKDVGFIFGFCKTDYVPNLDEDNTSSEENSNNV